jgi:hypothetical protein
VGATNNSTITTRWIDPAPSSPSTLSEPLGVVILQPTNKQEINPNTTNVDNSFFIYICIYFPFLSVFLFLLLGKCKNYEI